MKKVDLNCDLGESYGNRLNNHDADIMPYISSCNIACGFHSGDPYTIEQTIDLAIENDVAIGAHPSFPDLQGFGRRHIDMPLLELQSVVKFQVAAIKGMVESKGKSLHHVKPHGALYNTAAVNEEYAHAIVEAIYSIDPQIILYGLSGSILIDQARRLQLTTYQEAFSDRRYTNDLRLLSRSISNSVLTQEESFEQVQMMLLESKVLTNEEMKKPIEFDTICLHSDTPHSVNTSKSLNSLIKELDIEISAHK